MTDRFRVVTVKEARAQDLPGVGIWDNDFDNLLYDFGVVGPPILVASDRMDPEDVTFKRGLAWAPKLLNLLARVIDYHAKKESA